VTEPEVRKWLGLKPDDQLRDPDWWQRVLDGMKDVPPPPDGPTDEHLRVFTAFLACSGPRAARRRILR